LLGYGKIGGVEEFAETFYRVGKEVFGRIVEMAGINGLFKKREEKSIVFANKGFSGFGKGRGKVARVGHSYSSLFVLVVPFGRIPFHLLESKCIEAKASRPLGSSG